MRKRKYLEDFLAENPITEEDRAEVERIKKQMLAEVEEYRQREKKERENRSTH